MTLEVSLENLPPFTAVVLAVAHQPYREWSPIQWQEKLMPNGVVIDVKGISPKKELEEREIRIWRL